VYNLIVGSHVIIFYLLLDSVLIILITSINYWKSVFWCSILSLIWRYSNVLRSKFKRILL